MNEDDPNLQHHWPGQHWPPLWQRPPWWTMPVVVQPGYEYQRGYQAGVQQALVAGVPETPSQGAIVDPEIGKQIAVAVVSGVLVAVAVSLVFGRKG